jgi:class 3 adenylate cyclase
MTVKSRIIALALVGNAAIALIFYISSMYQSQEQQSYAIANSAGIYQQAWRTVLNDSYSSSVGLFHPQTGDEMNLAIWESGQEADNTDHPNAQLNALLKAGPDQKSTGFLDEYFAEALEWGDISFVMAFDEAGYRAYCGTAFEGYGVDPCDEQAQPEFVSQATDRYRDSKSGSGLSLGTKRGVAAILATATDETLGFYHTMAVDVMSDQKKIGTVVIGKNLADAIEIFEYEFLVKAVLNRDEIAVELNDYYPADDYAELGELTSFVSNVGTTISDEQDELVRDGFWGYQDSDLGVSVIAVPLSDFSKVDESRLVVVKNEREAMAKAAEADFYATLVFLAVYTLILGAVIAITSYSFGGITKAIEVLASLTRGELDVQMPRRTFLSSAKDEVSRLTESLETYRGHLKEMARTRAEQSEKRKQRDDVIINKMSSLSNQLDGDARALLESDIEKIKTMTDTQDFEKAEQASTEIMKIAITRMSDEVVALIEARTGEIQSALKRNEELLLNILPESIAARKLANEKVIADSHECCSVLFGDIVGFTPLSKALGPEKLVEFLNQIFTAFDDYSEELGLEKIKTIGDNYMVACGVPNADPDHALKIAEMGCRMMNYMQALKPLGGVQPMMRIGIHSGPLVAGVIGKKKFIYDLWGDAVNTAARMESHGLPNKIHVSAETAALIENDFNLTKRGLIDIKGKGQMETYLLSA